jgi:hypothetical protein
MRSIAGVALIAAAAILPAVPLVATAFRDGPLPGFTGGFNEPACTQCHFDNPPNAPGGTLRIEGVPSTYTPGRRYALTISVARPGLTHGGFELASRFSAGPQAGRQAGTLTGLDARTRVIQSPDHAVQYIQHTRAGAEAAAGEARWRVEWIAPDRGQGDVTFHVAGNAANGDESPLGDFIYTASRSAHEGR